MIGLRENKEVVWEKTRENLLHNVKDTIFVSDSHQKLNKYKKTFF